MQAPAAAAARIDVSDLQYQVDPAFPPDKTDGWASSLANDGWVQAHNSIRAEMAEMQNCLVKAAGRGPLPAWAVASIQAWTKLHLEHVHSHHHNEDNILNPWMRKRFVYPDKLEAEHEVLVQHLDTIEGLVAGLRENDSVVPLLEAWNAYRTMMVPHLKEEEEIGLPLLRAYFTHKELAPMIQKIMEGGPPVEMGAFIHHCQMDGRTGPAAFRKSFMKQEGIPFFAWHLAFKGIHKAYLKNMVVHTDALASGSPPKKAPKSALTSVAKCLQPMHWKSATC